MRTLIITAAVAATVLLGTGCSSHHTQTPASQPVAPAATVAPAPIQPVPGSHKNKYNAGPFTVTLIHGIATEPDGSTTGSEVLVQNTSNDFTGYATPEVEYFQGSTVLGTNTESTTTLTPGQQQTIWIDAASDKNVTGQWVDAQLISLRYGTIGTPESMLPLAH